MQYRPSAAGELAILSAALVLTAALLVTGVRHRPEPRARKSAVR
ncbi:hypothetical protein [Streptomyces sp. NPDC085937]